MFCELAESWIEQSVYSAFFSVAKKFPDKIAIVDGDVRISYAELLQKVANVAISLHRICEPGQKPIAIWLPGSYSFIVCMLAVNSLKRAYLPLDASFPDERNLEIMQLSTVQEVIVSTAYRGLIDSTIKPVFLGSLTQNINAVDYESQATQHDLSYIIYTSGSSGKPKGVYQNQKNLLHDVMQYVNTIQLTHHDNCTQFYSPAVNGAIRDIYGSLLTGATLFLINLKSVGVASISYFLKKQQITIYHSLPGIFRTFLALEKSRIETVRLVYLAGDRIYTSDFELFKKYFIDSAKLYVGIGSTENATIYCQWILDHKSEVSGSLLPLGFGVKDRNFKIFDNLNNECKVGEEGEISVTSKYLALGYWNNKALNDYSFLSNSDGSRTFKTGDAGLVNSDGMLHYLGRKDNQVKINGYRVETDEIGSKVRQLSGINEACVIPFDRNKNQVLYAFVTVNDDSLTSIGIKKLLAEILPDYMVPSKIFILENFPLLDNFKIDYQQLKSRYQIDTPTLAQPSVSEIIKQLWINYTDNELAFVNDNSFYDSGGTSMDIVQLAIDIEKQFLINLPVEYIHSSVKPARLLDIVNALATNILQLPDKDYCVYLFSPIHGLTAIQISLIKKIASEFKTIIIKYPINESVNFSEFSMEKFADDVLKNYFATVPLHKSVFLGVCNGNVLAQMVAGRLDSELQPVLNVNLDYPKIEFNSSIGVIKRIKNFKVSITTLGFRVTVGSGILKRLDFLKSINAWAYNKSIQTTTSLFRLKDFVSAEALVKYRKTEITKLHTDLLYFKSKTEEESHWQHGWENYYNAVEVIDTPFTHIGIHSDTAAQRLIIDKIKKKLSA